MIDLETQERVLVHVKGTGGPYIMVPLDQVADITRLLRDNRIAFWVDTDAISLDGQPAISVVNLGRGADSARVQEVLDGAH